ncbi:arylsulfotransferase family protein [Halorussus gelatinilyticus]|uniref:Arylsulfotransferase family protein n=1 Tax=Halorussus gelatinilyticus TaxID=2937524 RepID=A0A8U0IJT8_9EURY|nr:aryl-sulfate sulfotransferase [Halorussus gelatinilyticus]UPW00945.1 arylsulfotransferase family protein [Halorussus gelatinilyticus]
MRDVTTTTARGLAVVLAGLALLVVAFTASWALAPDTETVSERVEPSDTLLVGVQGPGPNGNVTALDGRGDVKWSLGDIISYQNVQRLDNGSVLATFAAGDYEECGPYDPPCKRTGVRIIDPNASSAGVSEPTPEVVWEWSYPVRTREDSEVHDAEMLPSGNLLVADMEYESIFLLNPKTRERVWTWNASQHYDGPADPTTTDWLHLNDVDRIGDGRYLVSIRNRNQLLVVERGHGVVEVINENGDPDVLNRQHNPHWLGDGAVLVADSENHRAVELHENETTGEWEVAWSVSTVGGIGLDWPRDADRLPNGNTLLTDSRNNRVVEIEENGSVVASYAVPSLPYEADRLPYGEAPAEAVATYGPRRGEVGVLDREVPVLSTLLAGARHVVALPYWVSEGHLLVVVVALALWVRGGYLLVRGRRSDE